MLGVNILPHTPESLKKVMDAEKLNWRSFADDGSIAKQWNSPATPSFYVIDHQGFIRHKWIGHPGEKTMEAALEKLLRQVKPAADQLGSPGSLSVPIFISGLQVLHSNGQSQQHID